MLQQYENNEVITNKIDTDIYAFYGRALWEAAKKGKGRQSKVAA